MSSLHLAARLPDNERQNIAILTLAGSVPVSQLALQHGVSRRLVHQQKNIVNSDLKLIQRLDAGLSRLVGV
jgi:hypothetical protein